VEAARLTTGTALYLHGFVGYPVCASALAAIARLPGVFIVETGTVACAVRVVTASEYEHPPATDDHAAQLEWLAPRVRSHHEVLRTLHAAGTVVPFKFGALCPGVEELRTLLGEYHDAIAGLLTRFDGKDEWSLKVSADEDALSSFYLRSRQELIALEREHECLPEGRAHFARKKLQQATAALVAETLDTIEQQVFARLARLDVESSGSLSHAALLVDRDRFADVEHSFAELEDEHAALHLTIELTGPWPPYSFVADLGAERS